MSNPISNTQPSNNYINANIVENAEAENKQNVFGENVDTGKKITRLEMQLFKDDDSTNVKIAIKNVPIGAEGEKLLQKHRNSWLKRQLWAPLKIKTTNGEIKTVLVNINSLAKRLGISKTLAREAARKNDEGQSLTALLNTMNNLKVVSQRDLGKNGFDSAQAIKIVNYMEKRREEWLSPSSPSKSKHIVCSPMIYSSENRAKLGISSEDALIVIRNMGEGSFKRVEAWFDYKNFRTVALGTLKSERMSIDKLKSAIDEFQKEIDINLKYQNCEGLVKSYKVAHIVNGQKVSEPVMMQKCYRGSLADAINSWADNPELAPEDKSKGMMMLNTARGIKRFHDDGLVHRDIKPGNIYVNYEEDDKSSVADCGDFGLVASKKELQGPQKKAGTPEFMSPELGATTTAFTFDQWKKSDVWALGCVWYELICGKETVWATNVDQMRPNPDFEIEYANYYREMLTDYKRNKRSFVSSGPLKDYNKSIEILSDNGSPFSDLIAEMLSIDPQKRPTMDAVIQKMNEIMSNL